MNTTTFAPTHRITFTPATGTPRAYDVCLCDDGAYTREEWESESSADWSVTDRGWLHQGNVTPGGANGTVEVKALVDVDAILRDHIPGKNNAAARKTLREAFARSGLHGLAAVASKIPFQRDLGTQIVDAVRSALTT